MNSPKLITVVAPTIVAVCIFASMTHAQSVEPSPAKLALQNQLTMLDAQKQSVLAQVQSLEVDLNELVQFRLDALKQQDMIGVSAESFTDIIKTLQSQRIQLTIDLAGLDARREVLAKAQAEMENSNLDAVLTPLRELLLLEKKSLDRKRELFANAAVSSADVLAAQKNVLAVEVQIAEATARQKNSNFASRLSSDLLDASLERAEKQARLETTDGLLNKFTQSRKLVEDATSTEIRIANGRQQIDMLMTEINDLSTQIERVRQELSQQQ